MFITGVLKSRLLASLLLYTAQEVYKTVSCLLARRNVPAQSQLFSVRKTIFKNFFSHFFSVFEQLNEVWVDGYLALRAFFQCRCFLVQSQHSSIRKQGLWNVVFTLLYCHWTGKCLTDCLVSRSAWNCIRVSILLLLCSLCYIVFTTGPKDGLHFCILTMNVTEVTSVCKIICW